MAGWEVAVEGDADATPRMEVRRVECRDWRDAMGYGWKESLVSGWRVGRGYELLSVITEGASGVVTIAEMHYAAEDPRGKE